MPRPTEAEEHLSRSASPAWKQPVYNLQAAWHSAELQVRAYIKDGTATLTEIPGAKLLDPEMCCSMRVQGFLS